MVGTTTTTTVARPERCSSRSWGDLPKDIIDSILGRLTLLADYDRFGAVCSSWRRASLDPINRNRRIESSLSSSSFPLLILPPDDNVKLLEKKPWKLTLFDVVRGTTILTMELTSPPIPDWGEKFYGSTHGWLIFADIYFSFTLINPFYTGGGGGGIIRLPRLPCLRKDRIAKVVLSADPALSPYDYIVLVIYGVAKDVSFIKPGDNRYQNWTSIRDPFQTRLFPDDVVFHKGLVYLVDQYNKGFYVCDLFKERYQRFDLVCDTPPPPLPYPGPPTRRDGCNIVQSPDDDGELFVVYMSMFKHEFETRQYRVYKLLLAPDGGPATWLEMKNNLGDDNNKTMILERNHSVCIESCSGGRVQQNSIYFLNEVFAYGSYRYNEPSVQEVGIFNMEDGSKSKCYQRGDLPKGVKISPPAWFFPSLPGSWRKQQVP